MTYSLLVPCYNAEKYIEGFIENFSKLKPPFDEVLFYDDASTDNTAGILKSKGYQLLAGTVNKGPGYARNQLARAAKGDYIHFHDIDDEIDPDFVSLVNKKLETLQTDVIIGNAEWLDSNTRQLIISWQYKQAEVQQDPVAYLLTHPLGIINTVYKREVFLKINGFNEQLHCWEDSDLHVRLALAGATFSVIESVLASSIRHNTGISKNQAWCWGCRFQYLEGYRQKIDKKYLPLLGKEFEKAAFALLYVNNVSDAIKAFNRSRECGHSAPDVNNATFKTLKLLSPLAAFLLKGLILKLN